MQKNIYIYPITSRGKDEAANPYIYNLTQSLSLNYNIVNKMYPSSSGCLQLFKFFFKTNIFYFNWIENLPDRKFGKIQSLLFLIFVLLAKSFNKNIVWTMHNKTSHSKTNIFLKKLLIKTLLKHSNYVITHSKEGIQYGHELYKNSKIVFFPHPVLSSEIKPINKNGNIKNYDIIIWGLMSPYKGILEFVKYLFDHKIIKYRIIIIGKFVSNDYYQEVMKYKTENIQIINNFISKTELFNYIDQSKITLFTYQNSSVLSSGALIDTLAQLTNIVGPNTGSFKDLCEENLVVTYNNFDELMKILEKSKQNQLEIDKQKICKYLDNCTWEKYSSFFYNLNTPNNNI